ncbi:MAG: NAD(P)-dependent oxidoreductase [Candidatus Wallbacteria bacterium]|nr:NAD(P)-dependent oxidoreductase [Candidatus Wallbacteria bacterium]
MKRVLVTGASGFIGRHALEPLLARGFEVHALLRARAAAKDEPGVTWHAADLLAPGAAVALLGEVRPTHLLHFAWHVDPASYRSSPENIRWVQASLGLLWAFTRSGGGRAVFAGTCAEYDWRHGYCSERLTPREPATLYGVSKNALQEIVAAAAGQGLLSAAWGRIFLLHGPGEPPGRFVPSVIRGLLGTGPVPMSRGDQLRDFLHVADVADAFVALLDSPVEGPVNIGSGRAVTLGEVAGMLARMIGGAERLEPGALESPPGDPPVLLPDITRLAREVGWRPARTLEAGLEATAEWWRSRA